MKIDGITIDGVQGPGGLGADKTVIQGYDNVLSKAPTNPDINNKIYFIDYLDDNLIQLIDTETNEDLIINKKNGILGDESIETINILSVPEQKGFARQNGLIVGRGISIQFDGDEPVIINGIISNLPQKKQAMFEPVEGAVPKRDVDGARKKVVVAAKEMEKEGAFSMEDFAEGGSDMVE